MNSDSTPDLVLQNGRITTLDPRHPEAKSVAIKNGKIVGVDAPFERGPNTIAIFAIDANKGTLTAGDRVPTQGKTPRNFAIDPTGVFLFAANQDSDNIVVFRIDQKTGGLTGTGDVLDVGAPVCVTFAKVK